MSLETKISTGDINIHRLNIEQPQVKSAELHFKIDKIFEQSDWQKIDDYCSKMLRQNNIQSYTQVSMQRRYLNQNDPELISDTNWSHIIERFNHNIENHQIYNALHLAGNAKLLAPERKVENFISENFFEKALELLKTYRGVRGPKGDFSGELFLIKNLYILFPEKISQYIPSPEDFKNILEELNKDIESGNSNTKPITFTLHILKLINPGVVEKIKLPPKFMVNTLKEIERCKKETWWGDAMEYALQLKIILAKTVRVSSNGLEFEFENANKPNGQEKPLPQIKKF